jgi:hypothetical protein
MWWGMGFVLAVIWISLFVVLGVSTLRNGHTALFIIGIIFPLLWVFGAVLPPTQRALERGA